MNLKYRIYSVSSESQAHPASSLNGHQSQNRQYPVFWESQMNCTYPQQITIQFYIPVKTQNISLTFHQYKIPTYVEIFVKCNKKQKYKKLGFIQPNDNTQTNFLQKQIKTLYFEYPCSFIKILMYKNYHNSRNLLGQVALYDISVAGECLPISELKGLDYRILDSVQTSQEQNQTSVSSIHSNSKIQKNNNNMSSQNINIKHSQTNSIMFPQIIKMLENAKSEAVEKQDFQKASQIKGAISNFRNLESQIQQLEEQKKRAVADQDFDKCHRLKNQILKKKDQANFHIKQVTQHYIDNISQAHSRIIPYAQQVHLPLQTQTPPNISNYYTNRSNRSNRVETQQNIQSPVMNRQRPPIGYTPTGEKSHQRQRQQSNFYDQYDSQVVPALKKKIQQQFNSKVNDSLAQSAVRNKNQEQQVGGQESIDMRSVDIQSIISNYPKLQTLDMKATKKYQQYFDFIEPDLWRMALTQKFWKLKGYALDKVMTFQIFETHHVLAIMELVAAIIEDNHPINIKKCLIFLERLLQLPQKNIQLDFDQNHKSFVETILSALLHLITDTKQQFRKMASDVYKNLPDFSIFSLQNVIKTVIKTTPSGNSKRKRKINPKHVVLKMSLIQDITNIYEDAQACFPQIIKWAVKNLNDPDSGVKAGANKILLNIAWKDKQSYMKVKEQILKFDQSLWSTFQSNIQAMMAAYQESHQNLEDGSHDKQESDEQDIHKKSTIMNKKKSPYSSEQAIDLRKIQQSPIPSPNKMRDSQDVQLAYSQESMFRDNSQSHEWFASQHNDKNEKQIRVMQPFDNDIDNEADDICEFCYRDVPAEQKTDHFLNSCPVLLPCPFCRGQIYLREFNEHLLTVCDKRCHQQCPRCGIAFELDQINEHKARKICRKLNPNMERCPFCYEDIEPQDIAWIQHSQKCSQIVRISRKKLLEQAMAQGSISARESQQY